MCEFLLSLMIVGAMEVDNGWIQVEELDPVTEQLVVYHMPTKDYMDCFEVR